MFTIEEIWFYSNTRLQELNYKKHHLSCAKNYVKHLEWLKLLLSLRYFCRNFVIVSNLLSQKQNKNKNKANKQTKKHFTENPRWINDNFLRGTWPLLKKRARTMNTENVRVNLKYVKTFPESERILSLARYQTKVPCLKLVPS